MEKCSRVIIAVVLLLSLAASMVQSEGEYAMAKPVKVSSGCKIVTFEGITYSIYSQGTYSLFFSEYDPQKVQLDIIPAYEEYSEYPPVYVQWSTFSTVELGVSSDDGETYLLGTETGYAEK
ncbi:MAG: hypothetical protein R6U43_10585 [Candidatus Krumholzibacteriales bacterium]